MRPAEELRYLILAAQREGNRMLAQALRPLGVTPSQAEVIRILQDRGQLTLNGLGDLLVCESGNSPSRLIDRLASAGLVSRQVSAYDRRHVELSLTEEGLRLAGQIIAIEEELYRSLDAAAEGHDLEPLTGFLRAFVAGRPAGEALARRRDAE
ncbi:MarR family transcriptional regulator [Microtetraspora sp. NBRC 13810]|uniref:MarR family winged helix-turn-helix transcriptional regulator n=1 Tax=Microtetraspora sp. NBRC 13810 TaxID=3030990 RepID=UPI0024A06596|nr:winged helix DNA-binding protein [Microtetraspora sp. NBRC 13810]GLW07477.1 MarR family transcriptional regulator [Microtetraspora sp. NBRC 13810]